MIAGNRILYVRIDHWSEKTYEKLLEDCRLAATLGQKPVGIIFDLRASKGHDYSDTLRTAALFCNPEKMPADPSVETEKRMYQVPCVGLVGRQTTGTAEVFCRILRDAGRCLVIGEKTSGNPFPIQRIALGFGSLLFPEIPASYPRSRIEPILPDIAVADAKQAEFSEISEKSGGESADACLIRACDLLIGMHALKKSFPDASVTQDKSSLTEPSKAQPPSPEQTKEPEKP
jgi:C-terminal processing protease CtpA/Prc